MAQRNNRRDSIVQELGEDAEHIDHAARFLKELHPDESPIEPETAPIIDAPAPRKIDALDLSEFLTLTETAKAARAQREQAEQALQQAQVVELKMVGAWEGELSRLRRRYQLAENEGFDSETGEIRVVQQQQG